MLHFRVFDIFPAGHDPGTDRLQLAARVPARVLGGAGPALPPHQGQQEGNRGDEQHHHDQDRISCEGICFKPRSGQLLDIGLII